MIQLIVFRAMQGVGGSGLYTISMIISAENAPPRLLPVVAGLNGGVFIMAGTLGPVLGGIICNYSTWRWIFYLK